MKMECIELDQSQRSNIAENLTRLMTLRKTTENRIARDINIPVMTVRRLLSGETADPRISTLKTLADYFNVSIDNLIVRNDEINYGVMGQSKPLFIPVLDWESAQRANKIDFSQWHEWVPVTVGKNENISARAFALESRPSMYPRFQQRTMFIIDPELSAMDGDLVLINLRENNELTLRELFIDPPEWQLHPINQGGSSLHFSRETHEIVGVVFLTLFYNRKMRSLHAGA
jgi:SOS-response transcriptional repressor LexA